MEATDRFILYPRACGGTALTPISVTHDNGLSPRLRGNRGQAKNLTGNQRSIPAPAGEPQPNGPFQVIPEVYPRACGGTPEAGPHVG